MVSYLAILAVFVPLLYSVNYYYNLSRNIAAAKQSGLKYVVVPLYALNPVFMAINPFLFPLLEKLPRSWTESWLSYLTPEWAWRQKYEPYERLGTDTFLTVSARKVMLFTCSPEAISQIVSRRADFPKPTEMYGLLNIYGLNVVSAEGMLWRQHRKITAPPFTEKNNQMVWEETLHLACSMLKNWVGDRGEGTVSDPAENLMKLTLHVISQAGFGVRLQWTDDTEESRKVSPELPQRGSKAVLPTECKEDVLPSGYRLTYKEALESLLAKLLWIMLMPHFLLKNSPFKTHKKAWLSYREWHQYMIEIFEQKKKEVQEGRSQDGLDLMGALVRGAGAAGKSKNGGDQSVELSGKTAGQLLSDEEILANAFVFILAGHETTANSLHFALLLLAMNPSSQELLQQDLDNILGHRPMDEWSYEHDMRKLANGMAGAVMNETLRLIPSAVDIFKTTRSQPQPLTVDGRRYAVPPNTIVNLHAVAAHRHPKYWPTDGSPDDINQFRPARWLIDPSKPSSSLDQESHDSSTDSTANEEHYEDIELPSGPATTGSQNNATSEAILFRPTRGAYIPFSDGARACLGRRFALVEILAVLAAICRTYSVELSVSEVGLADEDVDRMPKGSSQRREAWNKARSRAEHLLKDGMGSIITLQMRDGKVPFRVVRRGEERFKGF